MDTLRNGHEMDKTENSAPELIAHTTRLISLTRYPMDLLYFLPRGRYRPSLLRRCAMTPLLTDDSRPGRTDVRRKVQILARSIDTHRNTLLQKTFAVRNNGQVVTAGPSSRPAGCSSRTRCCASRPLVPSCRAQMRGHTRHTTPVRGGHPGYFGRQA